LFYYKIKIFAASLKNKIKIVFEALALEILEKGGPTFHDNKLRLQETNRIEVVRLTKRLKNKITKIN